MAKFSFEIPAHDYDWRGNRLTRHRVYRVAGQPLKSAQRILDLCTSDDVVDEIVQCSGGRVQRLQLPQEFRAHYTHRLYYPSGFPADLPNLLALLEQVLTIKVPQLNLVVAGDWYKIPPDEDHGWRNTQIGEIRWKAKFWGSSPHVMADARAKLIAIMQSIVLNHPTLKDADTLMTVPGHKRGVISCGVELAIGLADQLGKGIVVTNAASDERPQAKDGGSDLTHEFSVAEDLSDLKVLIVDDTLQSGKTLMHAAIAARTAGASQVYGITPVRNMRGS